MDKEDFQRAEEESNDSVNITEESEVKDHDSVLSPSSSKALTPGWASRPVSRRALTTGLIAGGVGLVAGGVGLFTYLQSRRSATPVQPRPPKSLVYTYQGHVHTPPKGWIFLDQFAFLAWVPQSTRIVSILSVEFMTDKHYVSSGQIWDAFDGGHASSFRFPTTLYSIGWQALLSVNLTPPEGGLRVVWNDNDRKMFHVTDITTGKDLFTYTNRNQAEDTFPFVCSPDGRFVAMANPQDSDSTDEIRVRNLVTGQDLAPLVAQSSQDGSRLPFLGWSWSPDSQRLVSWFGDHTADLYVWQVETGQVQTRYLRHRESSDIDGIFSGVFKNVVWSPDNHLVASLVDDTIGGSWSLHAWSADNGNQLFAIKGSERESTIESIQWSPDSQMLAVIVREYLDPDDRTKNNRWSVQIWKVDTGRQLFTIEKEQNEFFPSLQWSPDSQMLAVPVLGTEATADTKFSPKIEVWRAASGTLLATNPTSYGVMAWSPDSKRIVSARGRDAHDSRPGGEELELWEAATGRSIATYNDPTNGVLYDNFITWSPDGQYVAVGVEQGTESGAVQVWKVV